MRYVAYVVGGTVTFEELLMKNQKSFWTYPLVYAYSDYSSVQVEFLSCTIINCTYTSNFDSSALAYFDDGPYSLLLNMSSSSVLHSTFDAGGGDGGTSYFDGGNSVSGMLSDAPPRPVSLFSFLASSRSFSPLSSPPFLISIFF
jgi:hypothetical protein